MCSCKFIIELEHGEEGEFVTKDLVQLSGAEFILVTSNLFAEIYAIFYGLAHARD